MTPLEALALLAESEEATHERLLRSACVAAALLRCSRSPARCAGAADANPNVTRRRRHERSQQPRPAHRHRRCVGRSFAADLQQPDDARRPAARSSPISPSGSEQPRSADLRRHAPPRRAVSRRPRADLGRRRLHVHEPARSDVHCAAQGRRIACALEARSTCGDRYTVVFTLKEPFGSFPINLVIPIVPDGAGPELPRASDRHRDRTGSSATPSTTASSSTPFDDYFGGRPRNDGARAEGSCPTTSCAASSCARARSTSSSTTWRPTSSTSCAADPRAADRGVARHRLQPTSASTCAIRSCRIVRVRQALGYAIDRHAIVEYLRRGLATPAVGILPPVSWAFDAERLHVHLRSGQGARAARRGRLSAIPTATARAAAAAVAEGVDQRVQPAAVVGDPAGPARGRHRARRAHVRVRDALRRRPQGQFPAVHAAVGRRLSPIPTSCAACFTRTRCRRPASTAGYFRDPRVDRLLDEAAVSTDETRRRALYARRPADHRRGGAVHQPLVQDQRGRGRRDLTGIHILPIADFTFLKDVARESPRDARRAGF